MKAFSYSISLVLLFSSMASGEDVVGVGDDNEFIIQDHIVVPAPTGEWVWHVGESFDKEGVHADIYICESADETSSFYVIVFHERLMESKVKFTKDLVYGMTKSSKKDGLTVKSLKTKPSNLPWKDSVKYSGRLVKADTEIHFKGYVGFADRIYALQYSGSEKSPEFFETVVRGTKLLSAMAESDE